MKKIIKGNLKIDSKFFDFINNEVDFSGEYPKEKNPPKIQLIA